MVFLGIDPDLHSTAIAAVGHKGGLFGYYVCKVTGSKDEEAAVDMCCEVYSFLTGDYLQGLSCMWATVEAQDASYTTRKGANPADLLPLANISGAAVAGILRGLYIKACLVKPRDWKGTVPKQIHQARILTKIGIPFERRGTPKDGYCVPKLAQHSNFGPPQKVNAGDWKHINDAIGLALYSRDCYDKAIAVQQLSAPSVQGIS